MSVESYLDSIRKNTISTSDKTASLNNTMKDLLNYESLKKAVSDGVEKGNKEQFKKLAELSKKILTTSDATTAELKEVNQLLKMFYSQLPKTSSGTTQVSAESWVKALKEVLDEFGDSLPLKFQTRLKYDIVNSAAEAGANPQLVLQQLNQVNINQVTVLQNIYDFMEDREKKLLREAEARKPIENNEKKEQATFWQTRLGKVITTLTDILGHMSKAAQWLGLLYVGMAIWNDLSDNIKQVIRSLNMAKIASSIGSAFSKIFRMPKWLNSLNPARWLEGIGSKMKGFFEGFKTPKLGGAGQTSILSKIEGFFARMNALLSHAMKTAGPAISKILKELFPTFTKAISWVKGTAEGAIAIYQKIAGPVSKIAKGIGWILSKVAGFAKFIPMVLKAASGLLKFVPFVGWLLQAVISLWDFVQGFIHTNGSFMDKVKGGLKRAATEFVAVFGDMIVWVIEGLRKFFKSMIPKGKQYDQLNLIQKGAVNASASLFDIEKSIKSGLNSMRSGAGYESVPEVSRATTPQVYESPTGTVYMGRDALTAATPLASHVAGTAPANASGLNLRPGVRISSQTADFLKRAGITEAVTSGMEGKHARSKTPGRDHYSGNKFDLDVSTSNATKFANTVEKLLRTPGIKEIRTEKIPSWVVEGGRKILEQRGYKTKGILFNDGYPSYATGPHLDVLIDPKYSGVPATSGSAQSLASTSSNLDSAANTGEKEQVNPLVSQMQSQVTKAYNEAIKLFDKGTKAPDQLASNQNKAAVSAITNQMNSAKSGGNALSFKMQNDITDANLAALQLFNLA